MPESTNFVSLEATVYGKVTGVNFRANTRAYARRLCLTGWVRNKSDGTVHLVAQGPRTALEDLLDFLHVGLPPAMVTSVQVDWHQRINNFADFKIHW